MLIDDPSVTREARQEYITITVHEKAKTERDQAERLLELQRQVSLRLRNERDAEAENKALFQADLRDAVSANKGLRDELQMLETQSDRDGLPGVGDLNIKLRNR